MFKFRSQQKIQLAIDIGNRLIKSYTAAGPVKTLPSWHKDLEEWDAPIADQDSVIIHYLQGSNPHLNKQAWAVGLVAQDLGGSPTFESEKAFLAPKLALAMIEVSSGAQHVTVERLVCALPNELQEDKVQAIVKGLLGDHKIKRNGEAVKVEIQHVEVQAETVGAFRWALSQKLFQYARVNGILDLGGKTGIGQLYTKNGTLIRESRIIVGGTYQLAQLVAQHPQLIRQDTTPDLSLIMDAISDNSLTYGTTGISFADKFPTYVNQWLEDIRNKLKIGWAKWLPELGEVVIVGGSAALAQPLVEQTAGRFKISTQSQFCGVMGMLR
ncbi:MAG: ParM/StbA family protein [Pseudomonadota bacterium]|nr:ParM/StbA family protein [Pseudomonadota bacterium]